MKYYVSGSSGNIGKNLCNFLKRTGFEVIKIKREKIKNLSDNKDIFENKSLCDNDWLILCHGIISQTSKKNDKMANLFLEANVDYTTSLVKSFIKNNGRNIILVSSLSVYDRMDSFTIIDKNTKTNPSGLYGLSKLQCEQELIKILSVIPNGKLMLIRSPRVIVGFTTTLKFFIGKLSQKFLYKLFRVTIIRPYILLYDLLENIYEISTDHEKKEGIYFIIPNKLQHLGLIKKLKNRKEIDNFTEDYNPLKSIYVETFIKKFINH